MSKLAEIKAAIIDCSVEGRSFMTRDISAASGHNISYTSACIQKLWHDDKVTPLVTGKRLVREQVDANGAFKYTFELWTVAAADFNNNQGGTATLQPTKPRAPRRVPKEAQSEQVQQPLFSEKPVALPVKNEIESAIDTLADSIVSRVTDSVNSRISAHMEELAVRVGDSLAASLEERIVGTLRSVRNRIVIPDYDSTKVAAVDAGRVKTARETAEMHFITKPALKPVVEMPAAAPVVPASVVQIKVEQPKPVQDVQEVKEAVKVITAPVATVKSVAIPLPVKQKPVKEELPSFYPSIVIFGLQAVAVQAVEQRWKKLAKLQFVASIKNATSATNIAKSNDLVFVMERSTSSHIRKAVKNCPNFNLVNGSSSQLMNMIEAQYDKLKASLKA